MRGRQVDTLRCAGGLSADKQKERPSARVGSRRATARKSGAVQLRHQRECCNMGGANHGEVAPVERCHLVHVKAFGGSDDGSVDGAEREIAVCADELGDA